jgi:uncharacterized protein (TIGR02246 family)
VTQQEQAKIPEDLTRLFVQAANANDADAIAALYEQDAVMAYPPGHVTVGRDAIHAFWTEAVKHMPTIEPEQPLPTLFSGDIALTSTPPSDGAGARAQVVRRQPDGSWLRLIDQPELSRPTS